ncbi:hypothetical protein EDD98_5591 [Streptomyces sp. PanSC19]|uniref:hypothetical protein n=1 Tax=Streptomyces sp. PanSC19 TaxID=1520455 RepID=UPI000F47890E|nr:hypothetical protein [Streptomyces sp. PanSC19]ROQ26009.1 hypothetical protein EDD98_5591 [Streptomyces sp. PanSC19]
MKAAAQKTADKGKNLITFGMRARDEKTQYAWKKFTADGDNAPVLELTYNRPPTPPTNHGLDPDFRCTTTPPYVRVGSSSITFTARSTDKDDNLATLNFAMWPTGKWSTTGNMLRSAGTVSVGANTSEATRTTSAIATTGLLASNVTYSWNVRAVDAAGSSSASTPKVPCRFVFDSKEPTPPRVTSTDFPNADGTDHDSSFGNAPEDSNWSTKKFGATGSFTFQAAETDVIRYRVRLQRQQLPLLRAPYRRCSRLGHDHYQQRKTAGCRPERAVRESRRRCRECLRAHEVLFYVTPATRPTPPATSPATRSPICSPSRTRETSASTRPRSTATIRPRAPGDLDYSMSGAYRENPAKDPNGGDKEETFIGPLSGHFKGAQITHNGDFYGGDGLQDLVAGVDGKWWVYPGDGYGAVNITKRAKSSCPPTRPLPPPSSTPRSWPPEMSPATVCRICSPTAGDQLWAFTGYNGASFTEARMLTSTPWSTRDLVTVADIGGDGVPDLLFRTEETGRGLLLRHGKPGANGGVDLTSLATAASSKTGQDEVYGTGGWNKASMPKIKGTPDANGDNIPDIWAAASDGNLYFYPGGRTTHGTRFITSNLGWLNSPAIG